MVRRRTFSLLNPVLAGLLLAVLLVAPSQDLAAAAGDMLLEAPFPGLAPEGITLDLSDGSFWVTSFLDGVIRHFDAELQPLGSIPSPFLPSESATGIAYRPANDTLLVVEPITHELLEIDKTGNPTGFGLFLPILPVVNPLGSPVLRGMAFHPQGGGGIGSVYVVETVGSLIYEIDLLGEVVRTFEHPDDPDGYPGSGAGAPAGGIELILDAGGGLLGIDLVGAEGGFPVVRRLDGGSGPTGLSIPLAATGAADVGGIARALYVDPQDGSLFDALYGTSEASAELFVVDGELPPLA
ncbi:MAG: hypothetical protein ACE5GW_07315, partial [Planctomycetota bacterium]